MYSGLWEKMTMKDKHADAQKKVQLMNHPFCLRPLNPDPSIPTLLPLIVRSVMLRTSNSTAQNTPASTVGPPLAQQMPEKDLPEVLVEEDNKKE